MRDKKDERNAKILSLLIVNSLLLQQMNACRERGDDQDTAAKHVLDFLKNTISLHGDGRVLYQDAHELARELGLELAVIDMSKTTNA